MKTIITLLFTLLLFNINVAQQDLEPYQKAWHDSINKVNCMKFNKVIDEFDGSITNTYEVTEDVSFLKIIKKGAPIYYLAIYIKETGIYTGKGVNIIICKSNDIVNSWVNSFNINKPNEIVDYTYINGNFYTRAFIKLNTSDLELLKKGEHMKYKLYISNDECHYDSERIKCLIKSK